MNVSSEKSTSLWMGTKVVDDAPALNRGEKADVVVVGSGIAGMSVAYELAKAGKDVVVIDRGPDRQGHDLAHHRASDGAMRRRLPPADQPPGRGDGQALVSKPGRLHRPHRSQREGPRHRLRLPAARRPSLSCARHRSRHHRPGVRGDEEGRHADRAREGRAASGPTKRRRRCAIPTRRRSIRSSISPDLPPPSARPAAASMPRPRSITWRRMKTAWW